MQHIIVIVMQPYIYLETAAQAATASKTGHFALLLLVEPMQWRRIRCGCTAAATATAGRCDCAGAAAAVRAAQRVAVTDAADVALLRMADVAAAQRASIVAAASAAVVAGVGHVIRGTVGVVSAGAQKMWRSPGADVGQSGAQNVQTHRRARWQALWRQTIKRNTEEDTE